MKNVCKENIHTAQLAFCSTMYMTKVQARLRTQHDEMFMNIMEEKISVFFCYCKANLSASKNKGLKSFIVDYT